MACSFVRVFTVPILTSVVMVMNIFKYGFFISVGGNFQEPNLW